MKVIFQNTTNAKYHQKKNLIQFIFFDTKIILLYQNNRISLFFVIKSFFHVDNDSYSHKIQGYVYFFLK